MYREKFIRKFVSVHLCLFFSEYLLSDFDDKSLYYSGQLFTDSAVNPCMASTASFIKKVVQVNSTIVKIGELQNPFAYFC